MAGYGVALTGSINGMRIGVLRHQFEEDAPIPSVSKAAMEAALEVLRDAARRSRTPVYGRRSFTTTSRSPAPRANFMPCPSQRYRNPHTKHYAAAHVCKVAMSHATAHLLIHVIVICPSLVATRRT